MFAMLTGPTAAAFTPHLSGVAELKADCCRSKWLELACSEEASDWRDVRILARCCGKADLVETAQRSTYK
jgi:hypothetical protein